MSEWIQRHKGRLIAWGLTLFMLVALLIVES